MALARRSELFLSYMLLSQHTVNMTVSPSLLANGRHLGCSEKGHIPLSAVPSKTEHIILYGQTDRQTDKQTDRHVDSMTDTAQRAESVKIK